jgi:NAD-dependent SIR2 family protein deacetylase
VPSPCHRFIKSIEDKGKVGLDCEVAITCSSSKATSYFAYATSFSSLIQQTLIMEQNYTQNIDTLENITGIQRVLQCHGSFSTASCLRCRVRVPGADIETDIFARRVPLCRQCNPPTIAGAASSKKKAGSSRNKSKTGWGPEDEDPVGTGLNPLVAASGIMKVRPRY